MPSFNPYSRLRGGRTATETQAAYPRWKLLELFRPPDRDLHYESMMQHYERVYNACAIPKSFFKDEFILKPERSQVMACEVCGKESTQTTMAATKSELTSVLIEFKLGHENSIRKYFYACGDCHPKIKKQIAEVAHVILALDEGECEHTD